MHPTIAALLKDSPVITDGAWGTQLQAAGLEVGASPDGWNVTRPDAVHVVAAAYAAAGSMVILTNTFRANKVALAAAGLEAKVREINRAGVRISRDAAGGEVRVFAAMGPTGKMLLTGELSNEVAVAAFEEQAAALADAGPDAIVIETMSDVAEAEIAVRAAKQTGLPVVASVVFDSGREHDRTMMGTTVEEAARRLAGAGADVVGANCGIGVESLVPVCRRLVGAAGLPVWIKPNAGLPQMIDGTATYTTSPEEFARHAARLHAAGATFIGGCCGTTPAFIRALRTELARPSTAPNPPPQ